MFAIIGLVLIGVCNIVGMIMGGGNFAWFIDPGSLLVTVGGSFGAMMINFALGDIIRSIKVMGIIFGAKTYDPIPTVNKMIAVADIGVRRGAAALATEAEGEGDPFLKRGLQLVADNLAEDQLRYALETEVGFTEMRHERLYGMYMALAGYGPAFGMLGTLVGLIIMLQGLGAQGGEAIAAISSGMGLALITTLYGSILANCVALPFAGRLKTINEEEGAYRNLVIEGLVMVSQGVREQSLTPAEMGKRLAQFLPPTRRTEIQARSAGAA